MIDIGNTLAAYFLHPDEDGRLIARNALRVDKIPDSYTLTRFNMLPYLFIISHKYPEINPYEISRDSASAHAINIINKNLTEHDFQKALDEILQEAKYRKREYVTISSITVHLRAGGYPARQHQMDLCRAVMIKNLPGDKTRFTQPLGDNIVLATFPTRQR